MLLRSIRLRNPYVDPMSFVQVTLLRRWRALLAEARRARRGAAGRWPSPSTASPPDCRTRDEPGPRPGYTDFVLGRILTDQQERILADERRVLGELVAALAAPGRHADEDQETLQRSVRQLDELFLLVVVGEFNAGKSAFINALLGSSVLEEGVTPTTSRIGLIRHGAAVAPRGHRRRPRGHHRARRPAARDQHRGHPRHQRRPPRARGAHPRVRAALRPRAVRHLRRPPLHRERARLPAEHPRLGQEDRGRPQQGRHLRAAGRGRRRSSPSSPTAPARCSASPPRSSRSPAARPCGRSRRATPPPSPPAASSGWRASSRTPWTRRSASA